MLKPTVYSIAIGITGLFLSLSLSAQYIATVAGNGISACFDNGNIATCTPFSYPSSVCVASNGDLYISCGNSVKKVSAATGIVTRIAGSDTPGSSGDGGPATNALMMSVKAVRTDAAGNLYIAEYGGNRVRKITAATGIITTIAGTGAGSYSGDGGLAVSATLNEPWDVCVDAGGNVFIADFMNCRIRRVDAVTGIITSIAGTGAAAYGGDGGAAASAATPYPNSLCLDKNGNLYISESFSGVSCRIRKITMATGIITTVAGNNFYAHTGDGGLATNASVLDPSGVIVDSAGNIYIAEYDDSRIRKVAAASGIITTIAGSGTLNGFSGDGGLAVSAVLNSPVGLCIDNNGVLYICDSQNQRVRKLAAAIGTAPVNNPVISITSTASTTCSADPVIFTAATTNPGSGPVYLWKKNGMPVGTNSNTYTDGSLVAGDVISCTLTSTSCGGSIAVVSNNIAITAGTPVVTTVSITASNTEICKGQNVVFTATAVNGGAVPLYQWKLNGNNTGTNSSTYATATLNNNDTVSCVLTHDPALPCSTNTSAVSGAIVVAVTTGAVPAVNIAASANNICPGTAVSFIASVENAGASPAYQWKLNGNNAGSNSSVFTTAGLLNGDQVTCILSAQNNCSPGPVTSNSITMIVKSLPVITLYPTDTVVNKGSVVLLQGSINGPVAAYSWNPAAGLTNAASLTPATIALQNDAAYTFSILTAGNCTDSLTANIKVVQKLFMPKAFTPNSDGRNDVFRIPPNVSLVLKEFIIFDRWGNKVFSTSDIAAGWDGTFKNENENPGVYIYVIKGAEQNKNIVLKGSFILIR